MKLTAAGWFAGSRQLQLRDPERSVTVPVLVLYPCSVPSVATAFGPCSLDVSPGADVAPGRFPVVALSHGNGGTPLAYRTIGTHLARQGYLVAMLEHPGNNRNDNGLSGTLENLVNRPRHLQLAIDAVLAYWHASAQLDAVAAIGHSIGAYTALALAGGHAHSEAGEPVPVQPDPRLRALVLLAPAAAWFLAPEALRRVNLPILLLEGEHDSVTPKWHGTLVQDGVAHRARVTRRSVPGAGHFSFLSPFPPSMVRPDFPPCTDPPGFDRQAFHQELPLEVCAFLDRHLKVAA